MGLYELVPVGTLSHRYCSSSAAERAGVLHVFKYGITYEVRFVGHVLEHRGQLPIGFESYNFCFFFYDNSSVILCNTKAPSMSIGT